jgi:hypothetical protein
MHIEKKIGARRLARLLTSGFISALGLAVNAYADDGPSAAALALAKPVSVEFVRNESDIDMESADPLPYVVDLYRVKIRVEKIVAGSLKPPRNLTVEITQIRGQNQVDLRRVKQIYIVLVESQGRFASRSKKSWGIPQRVACLRGEEFTDTELERRFQDLQGVLIGCAWL